MHLLEGLGAGVGGGAGEAGDDGPDLARRAALHRDHAEGADACRVPVVAVGQAHRVADADCVGALVDLLGGDRVEGADVARWSENRGSGPAILINVEVYLRWSQKIGQVAKVYSAF